MSDEQNRRHGSKEARSFAAGLVLGLLCSMVVPVATAVFYPIAFNTWMFVVFLCAQAPIVALVVSKIVMRALR